MCLRCGHVESLVRSARQGPPAKILIRLSQYQSRCEVVPESRCRFSCVGAQWFLIIDGLLFFVISWANSIDLSDNLQKFHVPFEPRHDKKPVFGVSDQVLHKPGCTATKDG